MDSCTRCNLPVLENEKNIVSRHDGSNVVLCPDCMADLKAHRRQKRIAEQTAAFIAENQKNQSLRFDERWHKIIVQAVFLLIVTAVLAYFLNGLENGTVDSSRIWWPIVLLYNTLGFWGGVTCPGTLSLLVLGVNVQRLLKHRRQT